MRITPAPVSPKTLAKAKKRSAIYNYYKRLVDVGLSPEKAIITTYKDLNIDKVKVRDAIDRIESGAEKLYKGVLPTDKDLNNLTESGSGQIDDALVNQVNGQIKEIVGDGRIKDPIAKAQLYVKIYEVYTYYRTQGNGQEAATSFTVASMRMKRPIVNEAIKVVERLRPTFRYLERVRPLAEQSAIDKKEIAEYVKNSMLPHSDLSENEKNVFRSVLSHVSGSTLTTYLRSTKVA
ncbi:MAG: hypothetical protein LUC18_02150 [Porphyromonadaceae bacterium]|nr:hypothetical protein [Porphyromonadaceae bacterium]